LFLVLLLERQRCFRRRVQLKALSQLLGSNQAWNVVIVVRVTSAAERNIARGTMVVTTLQAEAITAVVLGFA
jgi:hypothetical protein